MASSQPTTAELPGLTRPEWNRLCAGVGARVGFWLSVIYAIPFVLLALLVGIAFLVMGSPAGILIMLVAAYVALVLGVLPATILGTATTYVIGWGLWRLRPWLNGLLAALLGLGVSSGPAFLIASLTVHSRSGWHTPDPLAVVFIDLPVAVYVVAEIVMAVYLCARLRQREPYKVD